MKRRSIAGTAGARRVIRAVRLQFNRLTVTEPELSGSVSTAQNVARILRAMIGDDPREHVLAVYLDTKNTPIAVQVVSVGTIDSSPINPREVFAPAVGLCAAAVVIAHNHPSGDPGPSKSDRDVTTKIQAAGDLLGIPLLDHVIVGTRQLYSFASECHGDIG